MAASSTSQTTTIAALGVILLLVSVFGIYQYEQEKLATSTEELKQLESVKEGKDRDIQAITDAGTELAAKEQQLAAQGVTYETLGTVIPATEDVPGLYLQMEALIQNAKDLKNPAYIVGKPVLEGNGAKIPVTVTAVGKYAALKSFVATLEKTTRPLTFSTVALTPAPEDQAKGDSSLYSLSGVGFVRALALSPAYTPADAAAAN